MFLRGRRHAAALLSYLVLTLVLTWPLATQVASAIPGDGFDGWQNVWNLWWLRTALVERAQWPLYTDLLYYPTGVSLYFHTLNPFNGLVSLPVQLAFGLLPAYNFVVLLSFTLSGYGAFLLAAWVLRGRPSSGSLPAAAAFWASLAAGAIFTFAPVHMAQLLGHMQVFAYQWLPFAALYILRSLERSADRRSWARDAMLGGLFVTLAALCDWYFALYLLLFTLLAVTWHVLRALLRRRSVSVAFRPLLPVALIGATTALLLAPLLLPMVREAARADYMVRPAQDLFIYSASAADFLIPSRLHPLVRQSGVILPGSQVAPDSERTVAIGWAALGLVVVALAKDRRRALPWALAGIFFALLAMGPALHWGNITEAMIPDAAPLTGWSPYTIANALIPFMRISRSVSRFAIMVQLCVAVAAGVGLGALLRERAPARGGARSPAVWGAAALALILAEYWVAPYPMSPPDTPAYYKTLATQPMAAEAPALLNLPMNYDRPGYLLYQTEHRRPLTVAYISRDDPRTLVERVPLLQHLRRLGPDIIAADIAAAGPTILADLGVGKVVLDRYKMPGGREREYTEAVAAALFSGQQPEFQDERLTVYAVAPPAEPVPYLRLGAEGWGPLQEVGGATMRRVDRSGASVEVLHDEGAQRVLIRYRSDGPVQVDGAPTLASAPDGAEASIDLQGRDEFRLQPESGDFFVERLALQNRP